MAANMTATQIHMQQQAQVRTLRGRIASAGVGPAYYEPDKRRIPHMGPGEYEELAPGTKTEELLAALTLLREASPPEAFDMAVGIMLHRHYDAVTVKSDYIRERDRREQMFVQELDRTQSRLDELHKSVSLPYKPEPVSAHQRWLWGGNPKK